VGGSTTKQSLDFGSGAICQKKQTAHDQLKNEELRSLLSFSLDKLSGPKHHDRAFLMTTSTEKVIERAITLHGSDFYAHTKAGDVLLEASNNQRHPRLVTQKGERSE
jgi:hypothetical protein